MARIRGSRLIGAVVILACIGVVAAVFRPVQSWIREKSMEATCAGNLRLLGQAAAMYQNDFKCLVPYGVPFAWSPKGEMWPELLAPYLRRIASDVGYSRMGKLFICPAGEIGSLPTPTSYGMNFYCGGWMQGQTPVVVPLSKVGYPARTVRLAEGWFPDMGDAVWAPIAPTPNPPHNHAKPAGRHNGRNNVLWIDGHVSSMTNEEYLRTDDGPSNGNVWCRLEGPKPPVR